jgi:urea transport system permease protein
VIEQLLGGIFNGLGIGAVLLIAALGLAIVFGLMGVINLAHGEFMMLGAYATYVVQIVPNLLGMPSGPFAETWQKIYIFPALILAFLVAALMGLVLERWVIRFLYGRPLETLLATWGISLMLIELVRSVNTSMAIALGLFGLLFWGGLKVLQMRSNRLLLPTWIPSALAGVSAAIALVAGTVLYRVGLGAGIGWLSGAWFGKQNKPVAAPSWLQAGLPVGNLYLPYSRMFIIGLTILCVLGIYWFLHRSNWGLRIRAVTQNRAMSSCLGIPTQRVDALTFALGSGLAGIAGCAVTLFGQIGPSLGGSYIVEAFMVVVVGGVGNLLGTIVAALSIGILQYLIEVGIIASLLSSYSFLQGIAEFFSFFATSPMAKVMIFALIITFLQVRPAGLFPQKGRAVEV